MNKYLFIGGPADGQRREVPEYQDTVAIFHSTQGEFLYYRQRYFYQGPAELYTIYATKGVNVMQWLIERYPNPPPQ